MGHSTGLSQKVLDSWQSHFFGILESSYSIRHATNNLEAKAASKYWEDNEVEDRLLLRFR